MKWAEPTIDRVFHISERLRKSDVEEVWLSHRKTAQEAVMQSWQSSQECRCIVTDAGLPVGITGLVGDRIWLLGTDDLAASKSRRLQLCKEGRGWVKHCLDVAGMPIGNDVYAKNKGSIRWLEVLGFNVSAPRPFGPSAALFCEFWRAA
jgi:hypothetical protein